MRSDIRMVAADLDHTLLREDGTVSPATRAAIRRCRERGIRFVAATARPLRSLLEAVGDVPMDGFVYLNGAAVDIGGRRIAHHTLSPGVTREAIEAILSLRPDAKVSVEMDDILYANFHADFFAGDAHIREIDLANLPPLPAEKVLCELAPGEPEELRGMLSHGLYLHTDRYGLSFIMRAEATKLRAVKEAAEHFGIPLFACAAFGDDAPDIPMLTGCGAGIAMENATDAAKAAADEICPSNEQDGVARWMEQNLLGGHAAAPKK